MKKPFNDLVLFVVLVVSAWVAFGVFVYTRNGNEYRPQLTEILGEKIGREVRLDGPIAFSPKLSGVRISVRDVSVPHADPNRRHLLARLGKLELNLNLLSALPGHFFDDVSIENADILLEKNREARPEPDADGGAVEAPKAEELPAKILPGLAAFLNIKDLKMADSKITWLGGDGKRDVLNISSLDLKARRRGAAMVMNGNIDGVPVSMDVKTGPIDVKGREPFSVDFIAKYDIVHLAALGSVNIAGGSAAVSIYKVMARHTQFTGGLDIAWATGRPLVRGTLDSGHFDLADFRQGLPTMGEGTAVFAQPSGGDSRLFSDVPLPLGALKEVDADMAVAIADFPVGYGSFNNIEARLVLSGGNLTVSPFKARIGASPVEAIAVVSAAQSPANWELGMVARDIDFGDLQKLGGLSPFMTGKAGANIQLAGRGDNPHDIASSLGGFVTITAEKGEISAGVAAQISSLLAAMFTPGEDDRALNCLQARFIIRNGIAVDNGILIDSAASTIAGKGKIDFGGETMAMSLRASSKIVGPIPLIHIEGSLDDLHFSANPANVVKKLVGALFDRPSDDFDVIVPEILVAPVGENACAYTLDHPIRRANTSVYPVDPFGRATEKIQDIGKSMIDGLFQ